MFTSSRVTISILPFSLFTSYIKEGAEFSKCENKQRLILHVSSLPFNFIFFPIRGSKSPHHLPPTHRGQYQSPFGMSMSGGSSLLTLKFPSHPSHKRTVASLSDGCGSTQMS